MKFRAPGRIAHQKGLSLIELMVAILLSSLLLLGVLQMFSDSTASDRANTALARLQENGRVALDLIKQDLRRTSYQGCVSPFRESRDNSTRTFPRDAIGAPITASVEGANTGSDTLAIFYARPSPAQVTSISGGAITFITNENDLEGDNRELVLTNCIEVAIFRGNISARSDSNVALLPHRYTVTLAAGSPNTTGFSVGSSILQMAQVTYRVQADAANNNRPTLFRGNDATVADVENMQVLYGVCEGGQTRWVNAGGLNDTLRARVNQLQISLVIASPDNAASGTSNQAFNIANLGNNTVLAAANDQRLRRVFNTVVDMRNRQCQ
ncbi:type IV pilus assembly protein PilW [Metapseudomonas resinovorans]|uniref:PilW family protein n=1 Tax=Metapseudomonas resinovorans TaxID=53412 RepID=UPI003D25B75D